MEGNRVERRGMNKGRGRWGIQKGGNRGDSPYFQLSWHVASSCSITQCIVQDNLWIIRTDHS